MTGTAWYQPDFNEIQRTFGSDASGPINAALATAHASGGGIVYIPPGHYRLDQPIVLYNDITLRGDGPSTWLQLAGGFGAPAAIVVPSAAIPAQLHSFRLTLAFVHNVTGVQFQGYGGQAWCGALVVSEVHDVFVDGISNFGGVGIDVAAGCRGLVLRRCWVNGSDGVTMTDIGSGGVGVRVYADDVLIKDCVARNVQVGFKLHGARARVDSTKSFYCGADTSTWAPGISINGPDAVVVNCEMQDNTQGFAVFGDRALLVGCMAEGSHFEQFLVKGASPQSQLSSSALLGCHARQSGFRSWGQPTPPTTSINYTFSDVSAFVVGGVTTNDPAVIRGTSVANGKTSGLVSA